MIVHLCNLFLLSTSVTRMLLTQRWVSKRKNVKRLSINISKLTVGIKHSISSRTTFFPNPHLEEEATCFPSFAPCYGLKWTTYPYFLCNKKLHFILLLNRFVVYLLPTAMSSVTVNYTMDLFYLLKENFKNLLLGLIMTGRSFENLSYLSSCSLSQKWRFQRICSNLLRDIESDLALTKVSGVTSQYILGSGSLSQPLSSSMLKNNRIFSLEILKLISAFSLRLFNLV